MKSKKMLVSAVAALMALTGCSQQKVVKETVDLNALTLEEIVAKAKEDGKVESVGMPDSWANWKDTWDGLTKEYGIAHTDTDMSSAEELSIFESEKADATKDIGDVGEAFGPIAAEKDLVMGYKTSYWDSIPDWAKDKDGKWIIGYYGTMAIITNTYLVKNPPKSFDDILKGDYKVTVGDVATANQSQFAVLAAALAYGGSESNLQPGFDYFKQLAEDGRLDKGNFSLSRLEKGEIEVAFLWDYNALGYKDQILANNPNASFDIAIPAEGSIQSGYCTIINQYTKRPYAAALAREYILSDQGQINLAKGYARPVRSDVVLPEEIKAKLLPDSMYTNSRRVEDQSGWDQTTKAIANDWKEKVMAYAK